MRFGLDVNQHQLSWDEIVGRTRLAEDCGFEGVWLFDHFQPLYGDPDGACVEGWTALAGLGALTSRIRLGLLVSGATYRHPSLLAAEAATIDNISDGRLDIGLGAGWFEKEHRELGFAFPPPGERCRRLEEFVEVVRSLLTDEDVSFDGNYFTLDHATYRPRPVQVPHPPIWIGAGGEKVALPIVGRQADCWHTFGSAPEIAHKWSIVEASASKAGRDPSSILISTSLSISAADETVHHDIEAFAQAGVGYLVVSWPSEGQGRLDEFVTGVMPDYAG